MSRIDAVQPLPCRWLVLAATLLLATGVEPRWSAADTPRPLEEAVLEHEAPDDPPTTPAAALNVTSAAATITFGRFTSVQVNVNSLGQNVLGDAANEPSIAVDPRHPNRIAIGWRQFSNVTSNFRQAGYGWSADGGGTWTTGIIDPGVFRSDPVLDTSAEGKFFYNSLNNTPGFNTRVFPSNDGGATWGGGVAAFGGDKQWMAIDRTSSIGHGQIYEAWSTAANPTPGNTFSRSIDAGGSFQAPTSIPNSPVWGTLDVGPDGTLWMVGTSGTTNYVGKSTNARNSAASPTFTTTVVNLGGSLRTGPPNPDGLLGQLWIAVDRSSGPRSGWIYVLASVQRATDPLDVMFIRSTDGGLTWSAPRRINDDPGDKAYQWFGTMSVSPEGRIDAVWNDTRGSADSTQSALYYSHSEDGGVTWSANEQASPVWNCALGYPNQNKIGDYYHMISRTNGADLAWAATFNGEEDVYYLRIPGGTTPVVSDQPNRLELRGSPNPFLASTELTYEAPAQGRLRLEVLDLQGRAVARLVDGWVSAGSHHVSWDGRDAAGRPAPAGLYLARLSAPNQERILKLIRM